MDYVGRDGGSFHLNWSGHSWFASLLHDLGADMSEWRGSNDGERISKRTCKAWAKLMRDNVDRVRKLSVPDDSYMGGFKDYGIVEGTTPEAALSEKHFVGHLIEMFRTMRYLSRGKAPVPLVKPEDCKVEPVSDEDRKWVLEFAEFLDTCGGCEQC